MDIMEEKREGSVLFNDCHLLRLHNVDCKQGKVVPLQAWTGLEGG
jgi:hypothetical protein